MQSEIEAVMRALSSKKFRGILTINEVVMAVSSFFGIEKREIISKKRDQNLVTARRLIAVFLYDEGYLPRVIGNVINKDRTCVYHYIETHNDFMFSSNEYREIYSDLEFKIEQLYGPKI